MEHALVGRAATAGACMRAAALLPWLGVLLPLLHPPHHLATVIRHQVGHQKLVPPRHVSAGCGTPSAMAAEGGGLGAVRGAVPVCCCACFGVPGA